MESGLNAKEIEMGTTAESLELRFRLYLTFTLQLRKTQTYFGKTKISSNFPLKLSVFVIFYEKLYVNPIFLFRYFEVFKIDFNICENQKNE